MRSFTSDDGRKWAVWVQDVPGMRQGGAVGWETVLFDADGAEQRVAHMPAGWLARARGLDLKKALEESEPVRARWGALAPAGG